MSLCGCSAIVGGIVVGGVPQNVHEKRGSKNAEFCGKRQEKRSEIFESSGRGGDERDQTADLLNAMASGGGQNEYIWIKWTK